MIVITGAAGFIGSQLALALNALGEFNLLLVDDFSREDKHLNWADIKCIDRIERRDVFFRLKTEYRGQITFFFHLGARTDTTEQDLAIFDTLNLGFSKSAWNFCAKEGIPFLYASSAATYGDSKLGFSDDLSLISKYKPLNPYGWSKHNFDLWALAQSQTPPWWVGLKFFNVYGLHESHKGRMASVVFHTWQQIRKTGKMRLFRSHRPDYEDGMQLRDFVYVKDVIEVMLWMQRRKPAGQIFNLGSGKAESFLHLCQTVFQALEVMPDIEYIDIPPDIRDSYQYFTQAEMGKLRLAGYEKPFWNLEMGIKDYLKILSTENF